MVSVADKDVVPMPFGGKKSLVAAVGTLSGPRVRAAALHVGTGLAESYAEAFAIEWDTRRLFLWLPACAGAGVLLYLSADHEPWVAAAPLLALVFAAAAIALRHHRVARVVLVALATLFAGFSAAQWRSAGVGTPVLDHIRIAALTGFVEEMDHRRVGSRFVLRLASAEGLDPTRTPRRVRLTTRRDDGVQAGDFVTLKARLLPPATAAAPGGYAFARDAYFSGLGAVGSVLGAVRVTPPPDPEPARRALASMVERARNGLAARVDLILGGDTGAIAAAMVTGKRDLLSDDGRELIREAGIFHIITIAGVQMTLVAGLVFGLVRRSLALVPSLALRHPIKKWAAVAAIAAALAYDVFTGSRVGTQRALFMTLIMLGAVLVDRRGFTMRNLALAALAVILIEPESLVGASFQLSFAAVAALIAVYEARERRREAGEGRLDGVLDGLPGWWRWVAKALRNGRDLLLATLAATSATASFMAANFHELSPYVFIGNPLTLGVIEFFAVPGALLGCLLYPLGLDGWVWHWVGAGIALVLWAARLIAAAPASTVYLPAFAPWALPFLTLAVLSAVIWRTLPFRLTAIPLAVLGLAGTMLGPRYEMLVMPTGEAVAIRGADGRLAVVGRAGSFTVEQWLRADGDGRVASTVGLPAGARCDRLACIAPLPGGQTLSLVSDARAFAEDCRRVDVVVSRLDAPPSCAAPLIIDRTSLAGTGALGLILRNGGWVSAAARDQLEDRPWSPAPRPPRPRHTRTPPSEPPPDAETDVPAPTPDEGARTP